MSVDNGVYILACKDQFRVAHLQGIDDIYWSFINNTCGKWPVPTRVVEIFGTEKYTRSRNTALKIATNMLRSLPVCEYGISYIYVSDCWNHLVKDAKILALKELQYISNDTKWQYEKEMLLEILNS